MSADAGMSPSTACLAFRVYWAAYLGVAVRLGLVFSEEEPIQVGRTSAKTLLYRRSCRGCNLGHHGGR